MKFLILTQYFPPEVGASQVRLAALCEELARAGHQVEVVTAMPHHPVGEIFPSYRGKWYQREERDSMVIHRVWLYAGKRSSAARLLSYLSFAVTCLYGLFRANKPDYVFVDSPPLFLGIPGWIAAKCWRSCFVFNVADLWPDSARDLNIIRGRFLLGSATLLERWIYSRANYVTAVTDGIRNTLLRDKQLPPGRVLFLPNGVDTHLFQPGAPDESLKQALGLTGKRVVLYAGNHGYAGAVEQLLRAASDLRGDPSIHFLLVGDGPEKKLLQQLAVDLHLENITFHTSVSIEDLPPLLSISDLAAVTLRKAKITEGARPAKMFVMMAGAKPIVLAAEGEAPILLKTANAGTVVPPEDPVQLAGAIRALLNDPQRAKQLGANGRAFVKANFEWSSLVRGWLAQLMAGKAPLQSVPRQTDKLRQPEETGEAGVGA